VATLRLCSQVRAETIACGPSLTSVSEIESATVPEETLFDFAVPDDLLREAVAQVKDEDVVADLKVMPGTGEGKPPPLTGILHRWGYAPLVLMTAAALVPGTFGNGISLVGRDLEKSFHMSNASLGAVAFIAQVSQLLWAVPLALWADRGSRKVVAGVALLVFAGFGSLMALSPNVWWFAFLYLAASVGTGVNNTVHNSYLADAYPTEGRGRIFSWHNLSDPLSQTIGILIFGYVVTIAHNWRYGLLVALAGIPLGLALFTLREPEKGANESSHILRESGMDVQAQQESAPRVLLGSAVTRLLRIRSLYYELVAVAILGFAGTGAPLFGNLFFIDKFHLDTAQRSEVYAIIGLAAFLGLPLAYVFGDRYFRRAPQRPLVIAGICITAYGGLYVLSLYVPSLWMVVTLQFLANAAVSPLAICIFLTLAATAPPEMRTICFAMFGVYSLVFGGFAGSVVLGAVSDAIGGLHGIVVALTIIFPVCAIGGLLLVIGSRSVRRDITLVIEDVIERYTEGRRRQAGGEIPALQIHNLDFYYDTNQVLFDINLEIGEGEMVALLGTNGAGKSTLLRAVSGLSHPHRGVIRIFGMNSTYLEPEQIIDQGVGLLVGGKMTFPGLSVRDNLRIGGHTLRRDRVRAAGAYDEALAAFPELAERLDQPAGTLSGGEQQMLALSRVMMTAPRLLMIDELALGLAPKTVDRLMAMVRRINEGGATVILVEQSLNRALSLAERCFFMERGTIRFDGPTAELMVRDDLLRPVFLGTAAAGLGG
jgi:ABC-type branched-subunit amino acid transport system ATPase component/sugar phosphate permease